MVSLVIAYVLICIPVVGLLLMFYSGDCDKERKKIDGKRLKNITENCVIYMETNVIAQGLLQTTPNNCSYCAFLGIPYAQPPVNELRFEPPKKLPTPPWTGRRMFDTEQSICIQIPYEAASTTIPATIGSENCLYLNIYTTGKASNKTKLMPVVFWIHGGSFVVGSANSDTNGPDYLVEKDVVVVTINYRLGPLGFLSLPADDIYGNMGLKDQQMALHWIRQSIYYFGGDASRITLMGWSAGAASVAYHLYLKDSAQLFDKAIMMSGNFLNPWAFNANVQSCTAEFLETLQLDSNFTIENLRTLDATLFVDEYNKLFFGAPIYCFVPTLDSHFLPIPPAALIEQRPTTIVPLMIGTTSIEFENNFSIEYFKLNLNFPNTNQQTLQLLQQFLYKTINITNELDSAGAIERLMAFRQKLCTIVDLHHGIHQFINSYKNNENIFMYKFSFDGKFGHFRDKSVKSTAEGAVHGDDLGYLFRDFFDKNNNNIMVDVNKINLENEMLTRRRMVQMWTDFIKFGNPTPSIHQEQKDLLQLPKWPPYGDKRLLLDINLSLSIKRNGLASTEEFKLWDAIYKCLYEIDCQWVNQYLIGSKKIKL